MKFSQLLLNAFHLLTTVSPLILYHRKMNLNSKLMVLMIDHLIIIIIMSINKSLQHRCDTVSNKPSSNTLRYIGTGRGDILHN